MFKRRLFISVFMFGAVFGAVSCGYEGDDALEIDQSILGEEPSCGNVCPELCWIDISSAGQNRVVRVWIFEANELPATPLENGTAHLSYSSGNWTKPLADVVNNPVQQTVNGAFSIPPNFNVSASDLTAEIVLGSPEQPIECGHKVL